MGTVSAASRRRWYIYITVFAVLCMVSLIADRFTVHNPELANLMIAKKAPCREYLMGTDWLGRCIACRIIAGAKSSIFASLVSVILSMACGCILGIISGYAGGRVDEVLMRIVDIFLAFPGMVLSLAVAGMLGPGIRNGVLALAATSWTQYARLIRSYVLSIRQENYVKAARLNGQSSLSILFRHVFPNAIRPVVVTGTLHLSGAMLSISGLSFLGLSSSSAEWGRMLSDGRILMKQYPWMVLFPALDIFLVKILFNLLGDSTRDVLDPSVKNKAISD